MHPTMVRVQCSHCMYFFSFKVDFMFAVCRQCDFHLVFLSVYILMNTCGHDAQVRYSMMGCEILKIN